MTNKENEILHYLINNCNDNGEISISDKDLADNCNTSTTTVRAFKINGQKENLFKYENKKYTIPNDTKVNYSYLVDDVVKDKALKYSTMEKNVLGYITDRCNTVQDDDGYTYSTLEYIGKECGISNKAKLIKIINKLVADGLIGMIKGDVSKKQATKYKVLFGDNVQNVTQNPTISPTIDNHSNNNININIPDNTELLNKILQEVTDLKQSLVNQANKFQAVEGVAHMLLQYIDELHHDIDNIYLINNIPVQETVRRVNIEQIRAYIDSF